VEGFEGTTIGTCETTPVACELGGRVAAPKLNPAESRGGVLMRGTALGVSETGTRFGDGVRVGNGLAGFPFAGDP